MTNFMFYKGISYFLTMLSLACIIVMTVVVVTPVRIFGW